MKFKQYIGLGDSISTDDYPGEGLGLISLLYKNHDELYPEFSGNDLVSRFPDLSLESLAQDGSTSDELIDIQLPDIDLHIPALITLTIGGNDLLSALNNRRLNYSKVYRALDRFEENLDIILEQLNNIRDSKVLIGNIYDPTDGNGLIPGVSYVIDQGILKDWNDAIENRCDEKNVFHVNIHSHFFNHGSSQKGELNWYTNIVEPNRKGGNQLRNLFLDILIENDIIY